MYDWMNQNKKDEILTGIRTAIMIVSGGVKKSELFNEMKKTTRHLKDALDSLENAKENVEALNKKR